MSSVQIRQTFGTYRKLAKALCGALFLISLSALPAQAEPHSTTELNGICTHQGKVSLPPTPAWSDISGWSQPQYYATIQLADIDGDGRAELLGRGPGGILVNHFDTDTESWIARRAGPPLSDAAHWDQPQYYTTIRFADVDGDGQAELVARGPDGIEVWHYDPHADNWKRLASGGPFSDNSSDGTHWDQPQYYTTIHLADLDRDGRAELVARASDGLRAYRYEKKTHSWLELPPISDLSDANGWNQPKYYSTIRLADVDGRGGAELIARGPDGVHVYRYERGGNWAPLAPLTELSDANGWDQPQLSSTIQLADIDGRPGAELIARGSDGIHVYTYNKETGNWTALPTLTQLGDVSDPSHADAIQLADIDGQPGAELILRAKDGVRVWHYNAKAQNWSRLGTTDADIPGMSDANGWNLPQNYLTIQASDVDGRPGAELIGRSSIGIETWRFTSGRATQATGTPNFPAFTGVQSTYYQYLSPQLGPYGMDIRADYDEIPSDQIGTILSTKLPAAAPPKGVSPTDPAWLAVKGQIGTELSYVQVATDWVLGTEGTQTLISQIFTDTGLNANGVAAKLSDVSQSDKIAAELFSLLTKIAQGIASTAGVPVAPGIASLLNTAFSELNGNGSAPNLTIAVGEVDARLATLYNDALNANDDTHLALVTNWSQLKAFAASRVGTVPTDQDRIAMRLAGELSFAEWLWQSISPAVWRINIPFYNVHVNPNNCYYSIQLDYPSDGPTYAFNSDGCGPAWIGVDCGIFSCDSVTEGAVKVPFGGSCPSGVDCRDPVNGPLLLNSVDMFLGRNGWNLPCFDQNDTCTLGLENPTLGAERAGSARESIQSLITLVQTSVPDRATQESLIEPLNAALAVLGPGSTQRDFTMSALQNFISLVKSQAACELPADATASLVALAHEIRAQVADEALLAVVYTRPGH